MAKVKSKKRKMSHGYKNEIPSEVSNSFGPKKDFSMILKGQESALHVLAQDMQHVNDYSATTLQQMSYDNFAYFTGKESTTDLTQVFRQYLERTVETSVTKQKSP